MDTWEDKKKTNGTDTEYEKGWKDRGKKIQEDRKEEESDTTDRLTEG